MSHVLFLGVILSDYPRVSRLRAEFELRGLTTVDIDVDDNPGYWRKCGILARGVWRFRNADVEVIVLPEFALKYAWLGRLAATLLRARFVVDWFVGVYETRADWQNSPRLKGALWKRMDRFAARAPDFLLTDTYARASMLRTEYDAPTEPFVLPVGAPSWAKWYPREESTRRRILYYGSYLPLHGLEWALPALIRFSEATNAEYTFIGKGNLRPRVEALVEALAAGDRFDFIDHVPESELAHVIAAHDVVLGVFGTSRKAETVVPNKVWQGLACGRPVVTRGTEGIRELRSVVRTPLLVTCDDEASFHQALHDACSQRDFVSRDPEVWQVVESYVASHYADFLDELISRNVDE